MLKGNARDRATDLICNRTPRRQVGAFPGPVPRHQLAVAIWAIVRHGFCAAYVWVLLQNRRPTLKVRLIYLKASGSLLKLIGIMPIEELMAMARRFHSLARRASDPLTKDKL